MCGSEHCYKIAKFWVKATAHGHRSSGDVDDVQRRSIFAQKDHNLPPLTFSSSQNWRHWRKESVWGDKRNIETGAVGDTKQWVSEVFGGLEKTLA